MYEKGGKMRLKKKRGERGKKIINLPSKSLTKGGLIKKTQSCCGGHLKNTHSFSSQIKGGRGRGRGEK